MSKTSHIILLSIMVLGTYTQKSFAQDIEDGNNLPVEMTPDASVTVSGDTKDEPYDAEFRDNTQNGRSDVTIVRKHRGQSVLDPEFLFKHHQISKPKYPSKRFLDHAMLDLGAGVLWGTARDVSGRYSMGSSPEFRIGLGDWVTPEHGWRMSFNMGNLPVTTWGWHPGLKHTYDPMQFSLGGEYMLNLSAVSTRKYDKPKMLEFYGVAGLDLGLLTYKDLSEKNKTGLNVGAHLGLRGVYNFSANNYLYLEPELRVYRPGDLLAHQNGDEYAVGLGVTAGIGFRKNPFSLGFAAEKDTLSAVGNDWFLQTAGGLAFPTDRFGAMGPRLNVSVGKWLNRTSGVRVGFNAAAHRIFPDQPRNAAIGVEADYLWNVTRAFSANPTYDRPSEKRFSLIYLLGLGYNFSDRLVDGRRGAFGVGTGFQFNYRIAPMTDFYLEPRVDYYQKDYLQDFPASNPDKSNIVVSLLAGFAFHQGMHTEWLRQRNEDFTLNSWYDRLFIQGAIGAGLPISTSMIRADKKYKMAKPKAFIAVGKWFTATHGVRLFADGGTIRQAEHMQSTYGGSVGAEYLWNISNALAGYRVDRPFEFIAGLGAGVGWLTRQSKKVHPMFAADLQVHYNITPQWSIYAEPQLRLYAKNYLVGAGTNLDVLGNFMIGTQLRTSSLYEASLANESFKATNRTFYGVAGGFTFPMRRTNTPFGYAGRFSVGRWITPISAFRVNFTMLGYHKDFAYKERMTVKPQLGGDFLFDIFNLAYGYDNERLFTLRPVLGGNIGLGLYEKTGAELNGDVHVGMQGAFRVARNTEVYVEPQMVYGFFKGGWRRDHVNPTIYVGFNQNIEGVNVTMQRIYHRVQDTRAKNAEENLWTDDQQWFNKMFYEVGAGPELLWSSTATHDLKHYLGAGAYLGVGRWFNRQMGVRMRLDGGRAYAPANTYEVRRRDNIGLGFEYIHSVTNAIWGYNPNRTIDLNIFAGPRLTYVRSLGKIRLGGNLGAQVLWNVNPIYSVFLQPDFTLYKKDAIYARGAGRLNIHSDLMAGLQVHAGNYDYAAAQDQFLQSDRSFYGFAAGYTHTLRRSSYTNGFAGRFSAGRWLNSMNGFRANFTMTGFKNEPYTHQQRVVRAMLGADYLIDVTNLAYGYGQHVVHFRPLVGGNVGFGFYQNTGAEFDADVHVGLQAAFPVGNGFEFYVEPQIAYLFDKKGAGRLDRVTPIIYGGVVKNINGVTAKLDEVFTRVRRIRETNAEENPWTDDDRIFNKMFFEFGAGPQLLWSRAASHNIKDFMGYGAYMAFGRWFTAQNGLRLSLNGARMYRPENGSPVHHETLGFGIEYAQSISNAIWKYNPDRLFDVNAYVGPHFQLFRQNEKMRVGLNVAIQPMININHTYSIFLQPEFTFYRKGAIYNTSINGHITNNLMVGLQVHPDNYRLAESRRLFDEAENHSFVSVGVGMAAPFRNFQSYGKQWGGLGRFSYGHWFLPNSAWRINVEGRAYRHSNINFRTSAEAVAGVDYLLDLTTLAFGYRDDRRFYLRALAGVNIGANYMRQHDGRLHFLGDIHTGGQIAARVGSRAELYLEPTVRYNWAGRVKGSRLSNAFPQIVAGMSYRLGTKAQAELTDEQQKSIKKRFATGAIGTGCNTTTLLVAHGGRKFTFDADLTYGQWINYLGAWRVGVSNSYFRTSPVSECKDSHDNVSIHADYMLNLLSLFRGDETRHLSAELAAFVGLNYNLSFATDKDLKQGLGAEAGLQLGYKLTPNVALFMEPAVTIHGHKLYNQWGHGIDGSGRLLLGVKYAF